MIRRRNKRSKPAKAGRDIDKAEARLARRKQSLAARSSDIRGGIKSRLAKPDGLILVAGAGFVLARDPGSDGVTDLLASIQSSLSSHDGDPLLQVAIDFAMRSFASGQSTG